MSSFGHHPDSIGTLSRGVDITISTSGVALKPRTISLDGLNSGEYALDSYRGPL